MGVHFIAPDTKHLPILAGLRLAFDRAQMDMGRIWLWPGTAERRPLHFTLFNVSDELHTWRLGNTRAGAIAK